MVSDEMGFFLAWGSDWKYKAKPDGLTIGKFCPNCHSHGDFFEVVPVKYFTLFWIPLMPVEEKKSLLECPSCQERFYIQPDDYYSAIKRGRENVIMTPSPARDGQQEGASQPHHVFECDQCNTRLRVPRRKETLRVACPKCRNSFLVKEGARV